MLQAALLSAGEAPVAASSVLLFPTMLAHMAGFPHTWVSFFPGRLVASLDLGFVLGNAFRCEAVQAPPYT